MREHGQLTDEVALVVDRADQAFARCTLGPIKESSMPAPFVCMYSRPRSQHLLTLRRIDVSLAARKDCIRTENPPPIRERICRQGGPIRSSRNREDKQQEKKESAQRVALAHS